MKYDYKLNHLAIIMDGNGRWAAEQNLPRAEGHRRGALTTKNIIKSAKNFGVKHLSLYAFSTENWKRPRVEIDLLMSLLKNYIINEAENLNKENIKLIVVGDILKLDESLRNNIKKVEDLTRNNDAMVVYVALSYSARQELIYAINNIINSEKKIINEATIAQNMYCSDMPNVDLLIRTSGEQRVSNFLLWHIAYAELYFHKKYWPDFEEADLLEALEEFNTRVRRFGRI